MTGQPVFVVGVQRSGTTLLAAMLNAHSGLSCGPETHVFSHLHPYLSRRALGRRRLRRRLFSDWPDSALALLCSIQHAHTPMVSNHGFTTALVKDYLGSNNPGLVTIASSMPDLYRVQARKRRWVEKTPDNIRYIDTVRALFPEAPIVRIVRDPRDVALSLSRVPFGPKTVVDALNSWIAHHSVSEDFFRTDHNSCTIKYEDLVTDPVATMTNLCDFIGEEFEPGMLDTSNSARDVNRTAEPWKNKAGEPPDTGRVKAWRRSLSPDMNRLAEMIAGDRMLDLQYDVRNEFPYYCEFFPAVTSTVTKPASELASRGYRTWKADSGERPEMRIFAGHPDSGHWLTGESSKRPFKLLRIAGTIVASRVAGIPVKWFPGAEQQEHPSKCGRVLTRMLAGAKTQVP